MIIAIRNIHVKTHRGYDNRPFTAVNCKLCACTDKNKNISPNGIHSSTKEYIKTQTIFKDTRNLRRNVLL